MAHDWICGARRPRPQPQEHRRRHPAPQAGGHHRPVGLGQVVARLRHDLRRRAAPLRRVAVGLRAAVPRADGEARRRSDRRAVAGDLDRAEDDRVEPALDGRHGHRDLRLPAPAVRQHRRAALPELRQGDRQPVARAHRRHGDAVSAGRAHQRAGADRPRPQGRVQEGARRRCAGAATPRRASTASSASLEEDIKLDRRRNHTIEVRRRSRDRPRRRRAPADRVGRRRAQPRRRHRRHQHVRRRRSAVLAAAGVRRLRPEHARDDAARVLVQLAARRLHRLPGARLDDRLRSAPRRARRERSRSPTARSRRGRAATASWCGRAAGAVARLRHRPERAVLRGCRGRRARCCCSAPGKAVRGPAAEPAPPLRRGQLGGAGGARRVPLAAAVPGLPRPAAEAAEPVGQGEGADDLRLREPADRRSAAMCSTACSSPIARRSSPSGS